MDELISRDELLHDLSYCAPELWADREYVLAKIEKQHSVDAVPIRPLARWLAGYAMPPKNYYSGIRADAEERAKAWELWIRNLMENGGLDDGGE